MRVKIITLFILLLLVLSACGPQAASPAPFAAGSSQSWIDAPLPGSHLPLAPVEIVAHASSRAGIASFEIDLNGQPLASANPDPIGQSSANPDPIGQRLVYMRYFWQPTAPGTYLIEVKPMDNSGLPGAPVQVTVVVGEPTPTITPTGTQTPTPTCGPLTFTPSINAYCREGPKEIFAALEEPAMKGQAYLMDGRNADGSWYRIMLTPNQGCWVPAGVGTPSCDPGKLRVLLDIPTPVTACSSFTDRAACNAQSTCQWNLTISGPGVCASK